MRERRVAGEDVGHMSPSAQPPFLCVGIWRATSPDGTGSKTWQTGWRMLAAETVVFSVLSDLPWLYISDYTLFVDFAFTECETEHRMSFH